MDQLRGETLLEISEYTAESLVFLTNRTGSCLSEFKIAFVTATYKKGEYPTLNLALMKAFLPKMLF